jgi:hypothetical protein
MENLGFLETAEPQPLPSDLGYLEEPDYLPDVDWSMLEQFEANRKPQIDYLENATYSNARPDWNWLRKEIEAMEAVLNEDAKLQAALDYASIGWHIFPCHTVVAGKCSCGKDCGSPGKHPATPHGVKDATTDEATIRAWWTSNPHYNIGLACGITSHVVVIDLEKEFFGLDKPGIYIPQGSIRSRTGGGGEHVFYVYPAGLEVKNSVKTLGQYVDVRSTGGYVILPPGDHVSGGQYTWLADPLVESIEPLPQHIIDRLVHADSPAMPLGPMGKVIPIGERNNILYREACRFRRYGYEPEEIVECLRVVNKRCQEPLTEKELDVIAGSACSHPVTYDLTTPATPAAAKPVDDLADLRDLTLPDASVVTGKHIWKDLIASGVLTMICGQPGVGKSEFLRTLVQHMYNGEPLLKDVAKVNGVVWITEEPTFIASDKLADILNVPPDFCRIKHRSKFSPYINSHDGFRTALRALREGMTQQQAEVLIVDTVATLCPEGTKMNEDYKVPVDRMRILRDELPGIAIVVTHHLNKGNGVLGNTGITAEPDVVLKLLNLGCGTRRTIEVHKSRLGVNDDLEFEYHTDDGVYVATGAASFEDGLTDQQLDQLTGIGKTVGEIKELFGLSRTTTFRRVMCSYTAGKLIRKRSPGKGGPYLYSKA